MRIAISGASGFLGTALAKHLASEHEVVKLVRRPAASVLERRWDPVAGVVESAGLSDIDAVVNLSGAGIADRRWTAERRRELLSSRVESTRTLARLVARQERPAAFLSGSAVGFYGSTGDTLLEESSPGGSGFLAEVTRQWEAAAEGAGVRTVLLRTGLPLDRAGGFLGRQLPLFATGLGGRMGDGRHWLPWIALEDWVRAVAFLLTAGLSGPVNLSAPHPVTNAEFTRELGRQLNRPTLIPVPMLPLRVLFGEALVDEALLASNRMVPTALQEAGFDFAHPELADALTQALHH